MKPLHANLITEKNKYATDSAWITLMQIYVNAETTLYFAANSAAIVFDGITYSPFPMKLENVSADSRGGLNDVTVHVSNIDRSIGGYVEQNDMRGTYVRLIGVNSAYLDDPNKTFFDEEYEITEITLTEEAVAFRLGHERLLTQRFPNGRYMRDNCRFEYNVPSGRGRSCGYVDDFAGPGLVSSGGPTINGTETDFLKRFKAGDSIVSGGQARIVESVSTDSLMTVTVPPSPSWSLAAYTVRKPTCDKILEGSNGCRAHNNQSRIGAFPGIPSVSGRG